MRFHIFAARSRHCSTASRVTVDRYGSVESGILQTLLENALQPILYINAHFQKSLEFPFFCFCIIVPRFAESVCAVLNKLGTFMTCRRQIYRVAPQSPCSRPRMCPLIWEMVLLFNLFLRVFHHIHALYFDIP